MNKLTYLCLVLFCATTLTHASIFSRNTSESLAFNEIQRVRIDFETPNGFVRHLLLGFTPDNAANDGYDYGYDALHTANFPNDTLWDIDGEIYVIQGVGSFDESKSLPLNINITNAGSITITLTDLENFESDIDVFIYDALLGTYTQINESDFQLELDAGDYANRFYVTFSADDALSIKDTAFEDLNMYFSFRREKVVIINPKNLELKSLQLYNISGQSVYENKNLNQDSYGEYELQNLSSGVYILSLNTSNGILTKKIIIK